MIAAVVCALAGLVVGAFLNVLIERIPIKVPEDRLPLHLPPSCTWCGETRGGTGWIPILGAVKPCPACHERPRRRELVVEVVTAAMFVTMSIHFDDPVVTIAYLFFCAFLVAVSAIDLEHYRIPDRLVFPSLAIAVPVVVLVSFQQDIPEAIPRALVGAATIFGVLLDLPPDLSAWDGLRRREARPDARSLHGLARGQPCRRPRYLGVIAMFFGGLIGVVMGFVVALSRGRKAAFPFGPALCAGAYLVVLLSNRLIS